jgi:succinate dehydrogenase / fumarate reductase, cytochrome b subunit
MSSAASTEAVEGATSSKGPFIRSRLGSLLAVVPLTLWTVNHLWNNLSAFKGAEAWQSNVTEYSHPIAFFVSSLVALLPLALHTIWGIGRLKTARPNITSYPYFANLKYVVQRLSAIGLILFLGAHLWLAMLHPRLTTGRPEPFSDIAHEMHHHMPTLVVYVLGVLGIAYHLANGLQTFTMSWGIVSSKRALRKLDWLAWVTFVVLLLMGWGVVYALWDAGGHLPAAAAATGAGH